MYNVSGLANGEPGNRLAAQVIIGCILSLLILWTLIGNVMVCAAVIRYHHLRTKVTNIFIVSLALSDLLVAVLVMPWKAIMEVAGFWPFGAFCDTWVACDIMCSTASILNLCVISVDRYWAISSPFHYQRKMSRKVASVMIGVTWTVSVAISFIPVQLNWHRAEISELAVGFNFTHNQTVRNILRDCDFSLSRTYAISSSLISFYIPVAIMVITYTRIYQIAQVQIQRICSLERAAEHAQSCHFNSHVYTSQLLCSSRRGHPDGPDRHEHLRHQYSNPHRALRVSIRKETKVLKTLSIIMGVFVFCWFPFFFLNCAAPFCSSPESPNGAKGPYCVSDTTFDVFVWFGWSNSSLNPVIYAFNTEFREAFLRLLNCRQDYPGGMSTPAETGGSKEAGFHKHESSPNHAKTGVACDVSSTRVRGSQDSGVTMIMTLPQFDPGTVALQMCSTEHCETE
ncbi:D(1) dopamine receptor [Osmerus eperlanus]|uniref:D(1) dopamine receptor n=1 Tax=Osmerus eperlanus TaxID=29151 RepID=UPI002E157BB0